MPAVLEKYMINFEYNSCQNHSILEGTNVNIMPLSALKDCSRISALAHETDEPLFITKNGYADLVVLTSERYQELKDAADSYWADLEYRIAFSRAQIQAGMGKDAFEALAEIRQKHDL